MTARTSSSKAYRFSRSSSDAGLKLGQDLRGPALASYLLVEAADGYRAVFALPEIDPACTDRTILLADRRDGKPLPAQEGPLRIVVPGEKRRSRWVRLVVALDRSCVTHRSRRSG